ncbi:HEAT repeat domain-containing protein [Candidatus Methylocalor cossyra]|uniref:HEAT repeat domain-containing protein n=1 Tax=Candidatus Methylocalor cossyra TaxID=3108543 RepID=UPI0032B22658
MPNKPRWGKSTPWCKRPPGSRRREPCPRICSGTSERRRAPTPSAFRPPGRLGELVAARQQLASSDPAQRVEGAEQLGAYPTKEAEDLLVQALASDTSAEVRSAAAQSLGYVEKPSDHTLSALLSALEDQDEDVRNSALSTLEDFLTASDEGSRRYQGILAGLRAKAAARSVPPDVREAINDILQEQSDTATP